MDIKKEITNWAEITSDMCELWTSEQILSVYNEDNEYSEVSFNYIVNGKKERNQSKIFDRLKELPGQQWCVYEFEPVINDNFAARKIAICEWITDNKGHLKNFLNKIITVQRKDDSMRNVMIMFDRATEKYAFVNLTTLHVCKCRFNTPEDALNDLKNNTKINAYYIDGVKYIPEIK